MRRVVASAVLGAALAAALSGCGGGGDSPAASSSAATSAAAAPGSLSAACARYEDSHTTARQVAVSAAAPILAAGPALFLVNLRQVATDAEASVPESAATFTELREAIDDVNNQATAAVPAGAEPSKTLVSVNPARLSAALDAADKLCAPR